RQIMKRSVGPRFALLPPSLSPESLSANERRFLAEMNIETLFADPAGLFAPE
ncbi:MAG: SIR2 family protein, partial [Alphaproteobacteria bacterium]|nr:SIR2 family protein [Alphaproteobacteria bacterium]